MGIFKALATWLEADAELKLATAAAVAAGALEDEEHPEGSNFADTQIGNATPTEPELHAGWRPSHTWWGDDDKGHISLRYSDPTGYKGMQDMVNRALAKADVAAMGGWPIVGSP